MEIGTQSHGVCFASANDYDNVAMDSPHHPHNYTVLIGQDKKRNPTRKEWDFASIKHASRAFVRTKGNMFLFYGHACTVGREPPLTNNYNLANSITLSTAALIPSTFLPPADAKWGCPPPPP